MVGGVQGCSLPCRPLCACQLCHSPHGGHRPDLHWTSGSGGVCCWSTCCHCERMGKRVLLAGLVGLACICIHMRMHPACGSDLQGAWGNWCCGGALHACMHVHMVQARAAWACPVKSTKALGSRPPLPPNSQLPTACKSHCASAHRRHVVT